MASSGASNAYKIAARPILSLSKEDARLRAKSLYRQWYRNVTFINHRNKGMPLTEKMIYQKLREEFDKNRHHTDIRVIDLLILRGQNELREIVELHAQPCHFLSRYWQDTVEKKPNDFMSKFIAGAD